MSLNFKTEEEFQKWLSKSPQVREITNENEEIVSKSTDGKSTQSKRVDYTVLHKLPAWYLWDIELWVLRVLIIFPALTILLSLIALYFYSLMGGKL